MNIFELYWAWVATLHVESVALGFALGGPFYVAFVRWVNRPVRRYRTDYTWNKPERLPPVGCPLVLNLGQAYDWDIAFGERISHLRSRSEEMDYRLTTGQIVRGRFEWSYP